MTSETNPSRIDFISELKWRGMLQDITPGAEGLLSAGPVKGYIGFDPTSDSLGVGNLVQIMMLIHFQRCGHVPVALLGGATGMVGDPSGKSAERNLLGEDALKYNIDAVRSQLTRLLETGPGGSRVHIFDNYDWFREFSFLGFIRDVGKHITVNYMMAKDSVQRRLETGISFTEFSYQLVQGYDFYHLWKNHDVALQMGGSDQWGNITTGTELIRRMAGGEAHALTTPLIKKADGTKFGKTEGGNIWLDAGKTSPYKFYQFWLNASDEDSRNFVRIFTLLSKDEVEELESHHAAAPHERLLQKTIARDVTTRVHSESDYKAAVDASEILFGNAPLEALKRLDEGMLLTVFEGVPQCVVAKSELEEGIGILDLLVDKTGIFPSRGEARKLVQSGGVSINKEKIDDPSSVQGVERLLQNKYMLVQKGKKNYYLLIVN